jgi:VWFA-related protein
MYGMSPSDQTRALEGAEKYLDGAMAPADLVAILVFTGRGVRLLQDFTDDREALRRVVGDLINDAIDRAGALYVEWDPGGAFGEDDDAFNMFTADRQLAALQTAVSDLAALPELKTLIYFGAGLQMVGTSNMAQLRATVNAAIRANVTLNPIDARGLVATAPLGDATRPSPGGIGMFSGALAENATTRFQRSQDTLYALAKDTGGKPLLDSNDLARGIAQAAQAVTGYYLIGYYTSNTAADGRYRRVTVSLRHGLDAELGYRAGYYGNKVFEKFTAADKERQLADALRLEDPITEVPMALAVNYFQLNRAEYFVPVSVRMPGSELTRAQSGGATRVAIDMIGELKDDHGVTQRNVRDRIEIPSTSRSVQYETAFTVLPGNYVLKVLARNDVTGRIGTFQAAFTVPNLDREAVRLPISSVVITSQRVGARDALYTVKQKIPADQANPLVSDGRKLVPSVNRVFSADRPLYVFLEAYEREAATMRPLVAFVAFYRDGAKIMETDPAAVTDGRNTVSGAVPIRLTVPLRSLKQGPYDCQVTVLDANGGRAAFWRAPIVIR